MAEVNKEWRLVPVAPTDDMIVAFAESWYSKKQVIDDPDMLDAYAAMLAVAPDAPEDAQSARIAKLERECERLRKEVDKRIDQGRNSHEMLNGVLRQNAELRGELSVIRSSEAHELGKVRAELEACRKDAERANYWKQRAKSAEGHLWTSDASAAIRALHRYSLMESTPWDELTDQQRAYIASAACAVIAEVNARRDARKPRDLFLGCAGAAMQEGGANG